MFPRSRTAWRSPMNVATRRAIVSTRMATTPRWLSSSTSKEKLFDKILIANRGEIAVRVHRTCRRLGIKTVQVYSEPDVNSVAVRMADEAICVGPAPSKQSYLSIPKIIAAVQATGAQAVHPGYGFLSENKDFCEALEKIGVAFIGPGHEAIHAMGDKIESKRIAKEAQVNTIPGFLGVIETAEDAVRVAQEITYPVMIKASAGGGGKGMRIAYNDEEVRMGFRLSKEEAASSFGDDRMFIEKFIEDPRHIEIQLIADQFGNIVPLPERECSIQRRNQKVIEEAPSVLLDPETRFAMGQQAKMLAKKVGYVSAGTVEFLCDKHRHFYFLEMNTRLQVEHPVTELISGVDLVEQMIRVAAGYALPEHLLHGTVPINGWAMESRVYAEDPVRGFLPSIGRLLQYQEPTDQPGVRIDSGVTEGSDISMFYDPLISKLITHGKDRNEALERMKVALDHYVIRGPGNNISFLQDVYRHPRFEKGEITTKFIEEEYSEGFERVQLQPTELQEMMIVGVMMHVQKTALSRLSMNRSTTKMVPEVNEDELKWFCTNSVPGFKVLTNENSTEELIALAERNHVEQYGEQFFVSTDGPFGNAIPVTVLTFNVEPNHGTKRTEVLYMVYVQNQWNVVRDMEWKVNAPLFRANIRNQSIASQVMKVLPEGFSIQLHGAIHDVIIHTPLEQKYSIHMKPKPQVDTSGFLLCPMPGMLMSVSVNEGEEVEIGQELCVVEAMKMQNVLRSEKKGKIKKIYHQSGNSLKVDEMILEYE